ncbi:hypothetical protein ACMFMF_001006 [Clarireedia jacksonii]
MAIDHVADLDSEHLHIAALLNIPCLFPASHDYDPDIPGPLCCVLDAITTRNPSKVAAVLGGLLSAPGIPRLYAAIYYGLAEGNCPGVSYRPTWTIDPVASAECLTLAVDRRMINPSPAINTLEIFCELMADPIDSETMGSVGCALSLEGYGSGSSRDTTAYVRRYLRHGGARRRNRAAGLAWDLAGMLATRVLDSCGRVACGALSNFPLDWALLYRTWTLGCQGSRRVAEVERMGNDTAATSEDLLWGYFSGITDYFDYERDWGQSTDNLAIAFPDVNWILEFCTRNSTSPTAFLRHSFLPTMWWLAATPQHIMTTDPAVVALVAKYIAKPMTSDYGVVARSCGVAIFDFIARRAGVHKELIIDILSRLSMHNECLTEHDPTYECPVSRAFTSLPQFMNSEDDWCIEDTAKDPESVLPTDKRASQVAEEIFIKSENFAPLYPNILLPARSCGQAGFSLSCDMVALEVSKSQLEMVDMLMHRLEHRRDGTSYCHAVVNKFPPSLTLRGNPGLDYSSKFDTRPCNKVKTSPSAVVYEATLTNCREGIHYSEKAIGSSREIPAPSALCGIESHMRIIAPKLMSVTTQHSCRPSLRGQHTVLFRYYNEAVPEHLAQLSRPDVFSFDAGARVHGSSAVAPTHVTATPEVWRGECWLMSDTLVEFITLLEWLPPNLGLEPLAILVHGFINIMSPSHTHTCTHTCDTGAQWTGIQAAIQRALDVLDDNMAGYSYSATI